MTIGQTQAIQGLQKSESQFDQTAANIARAPFAPAGDQVDLSAQAVALIQSKNSFEANIQALKVDDQMTQTLLNIVG